MTKFDFIIDEIFPTQEVHLIGGPSGAGKSTWLLQMLEDWRKGIPVLGRNSNPVPFVYLSGDRSRKSVERTFARLKIDVNEYQIETMEDLCIKTTLLDSLKEILKRRPDVKLFVIEGFQSFTPGHKMNDYGSVADFLKELVAFCVKYDLTIIGVCHATKTREDEMIENPRQRINGSVAWASYSETIIYIEPADAVNPNDKTRMVAVLPRNAAETQFKMEFRDGRLWPVVKKLPPKERFDAWIDAMEFNHAFTTAEAIEQLGLGRSTFDIEINRAINARQVFRVSPGQYRKLARTETDA